MYYTQNQFYIAISNDQRKEAPQLPFVGTVHNGIDLNQFSFSPDHDNYLLCVGRIVPQKGIHHAIKLAQQTNHKLLIIGPTYADQLYYFEAKIKPHLNEQIQYLGYLDHHQVVSYFQRAKAFLMPIDWDEPFGLTMAEAMACGTPVIAYRRGSVAEIVSHGRTGFIVDNYQEMCSALGQIDKIDRAKCREHVEKHFSTEIMVQNYLSTYKNVLKITRRQNFPSSQLLRRYHRLGKQKIQKWL